MLKRSILLAGLIFSYPALSASSDYVNSCADFQQQQSNNQITRKQAITLCQCTEERNEKDLEKLQAMNNPTQAQVKKLLEDSARYCLKKAGISQKGSETPKAKPSNNTDDEDDDQPMPSSSSSNGIKIRGIR